MSSIGNEGSSNLGAVSNFRAVFKFHGELNDFLPARYNNIQVQYEFDRNPSIKDSIEAMGVPHTEVDLIMVNGESVGFDYHLKDGDEALVYPFFNDIDISTKVKLRERPEPLFVVDVNLGKLVKLLRMCGFDAVYKNNYTDHDIAELAGREKRIVLTRDRRLLRHRIITHGYWVRSTEPYEQIYEVLKRYDLVSKVKPFNRCLECNGLFEPVEKNEILNQLEPKTIRYFDEFYRCVDCHKIYWKGSHFDHMNKFLCNLKSAD